MWSMLLFQSKANHGYDTKRYAAVGIYNSYKYNALILPGQQAGNGVLLTRLKTIDAENINIGLVVIEK